MATDISTPQAPARVLSVDAFRGWVMFLLLAEVLHLRDMGTVFPESGFWQWVSFHTSHVAWGGCSLHDLIQPAFSFLVGVALPFSIAGRLAKGQSRRWMTLHAVWRAVVLTFLGVFLRSIDKPQTNYTFEDTLTQIGLGYLPLFLLGFASRRWQIVALVAILVGYWAAFAWYPLPSADFDYPSVGVAADWPHHASGFAAHWNKNSNFAWAADVWLLNHFPRPVPFAFNGGGYSTLSFIPTLATMILGLLAGQWLRVEELPREKFVRFVVVAIGCLAAGHLLDWLGICPSVKRIWTPAWVLVSGGWCYLMLAAFYGVVDVWGLVAWSFPLRVIGANSIVAYVMAETTEPFIAGSFHTHFGRAPFQIWGPAFEPLLLGIAVLSVNWLVLYWMYRRKLFVRI
jgi:predicted acyltransferase